MNRSSEQLEREAEYTRAQLTATLDELRARMTPGQVFDEIVDYARDGVAGEFVGNLRRQVGRNPIPATLAGLGLAWLMVSAGRATRRGDWADSRIGEWNSGARDMASSAAESGRRTMYGMRESAGGAMDSARDMASSAAESSRRTMYGMRESAGEMASSTGERSRQAMHGMREGVAGAMDQAGDSARSAASRLSETAKAAGAAFGDAASEAQTRMSSAARRMSEAGSSAYERVGDTASSAFQSAAGAVSGMAWKSRGFVDFCRDQPLVLAGIGIAIGAALGAAFPVTEAENKAMGQKSDELKEKVSDIAAEQYEKAKEVGAQTYETAKSEAASQFGEKPGEEMPALQDTVSTAPSGDEVPPRDETAARQEELGTLQPKPNR
jgi:hypothetical protein